MVYPCWVSGLILQHVGLLYAAADGQHMHVICFLYIPLRWFTLMIRFSSKYLIKWEQTFPVVFPPYTSFLYFFYLSPTFLWEGPSVTFRCHWRSRTGMGQLQRCELWIRLLYLFSHHRVPCLFFFFLTTQGDGEESAPSLTVVAKWSQLPLTTP